MSRRFILTATMFFLALATAPERAVGPLEAEPGAHGPAQGMGLEMNPNG